MNFFKKLLLISIFVSSISSVYAVEMYSKLGIGAWVPTDASISIRKRNTYYRTVRTTSSYYREPYYTGTGWYTPPPGTKTSYRQEVYYRYAYESDTIESFLSPNINIGLAFNRFNAIELGFGSLQGGDIISGDAISLNYVLTFANDRVFSPHLKFGIVKVSPEWEGDLEIDMDDSTGFELGGGFTVGKKFSFALEFLYRDAVIETSGKRGYRWETLTSGDLDLSGFFLNLGVKLKF